jgi:8-oxo-dGTP diphosphatase
VLLAQRPRGKVYAGYWEFPGGKVEENETSAEALVREIQEELGVDVERAWPWVTHVFTYPHATVRLHFFRVTAWRGEVVAREHEGLSWQLPGSVELAPLLPANGPVLRGLQLPPEYAITQAAAMGIEPFMARLENRLESGLRLIQVREKSWSRDLLGEFAQRVIAVARPYGAKVLINHDIALAHMIGADGVHLTASQLESLEDRPDVPWCGASCHSVAELRIAEKIGADFAVLGPVEPTPSHPDAPLLGWAGFREAVSSASIPVYALGGMSLRHFEHAAQNGAHGVAMVRGSWSVPTA